MHLCVSPTLAPSDPDSAWVAIGDTHKCMSPASARTAARAGPVPDRNAVIAEVARLVVVIVVFAGYAT